MAPCSAMLASEFGLSGFRADESRLATMPTIVRVQKKGQVTIPTDLRSKAGIADGDLIEATFAHGKIILTPNIVLDRSRYPKADDEYTPEQRRSIDAQLKEAEKGPSTVHSMSMERSHSCAKKSRPGRVDRNPDKCGSSYPTKP